MIDEEVAKRRKSKSKTSLLCSLKTLSCEIDSEKKNAAVMGIGKKNPKFDYSSQPKVSVEKRT